ncbi:MAG: ADP-glyceromanno-heptose 6-epimerase [Bacteroidales bacterium]|nr:ADP-glyceromanno-heptose 6-epimerase [Bacteroidales bacterium]MDY0334285.1 ADP-glyceromanno-heptose 6-epimerase [Bacteroidales bacterium]NCU36832.1 ADP-glyceromanno-heptose 6-epimerase [Candidatus Falkowbacteria bacterium]
MIVITGAAGFIGSALTSKLNSLGRHDLVLVDDFGKVEKLKNLDNKKFVEQVQRDVFFDWLDKNHGEVETFFHIGARTDTAEFDMSVFDRLNLSYSKKMWEACARYQIPLLYASSAATYGMGEHGYADSHDNVTQLKPLNPYGVSKNDFDKWVLSQKQVPPFWAGFKFFNVYGPNEYHKGRMASVIMHAYHQIEKTGKMKLFRSHHPDFSDGGQMRDFVYVKDVVNMLLFFAAHQRQPGLYNLGTGKARTFRDLTNATFAAMGRKPVIEFIDTPEDIRDKYQYYTQADMNKVRDYGYSRTFTSLEAGVDDYVKNYLMQSRYL